ncbi:AMP-binding enzyme, partial [Pseudoalteromonas ruthenica]|uniref:AMP-binding enzyme n=1 Tax=Pseudoalteromonas ruthenica TaxID=151081 RepID=UPI001486D0EA
MELSSIEDVLMELPEVQHAIVQVQDFNTESVLVTYLVTHSGRDLNIKSLQQVLRSKLFSYQVPSHFVFMDS